jgi:ribosome biogenesis GTPase
MALTGRVLFGINNIYSVSEGERELVRLYQCRIKGKVLRSEPRVYNPIAAGDRVLFQPDPLSPGTGWILSRQERSTCLQRWNKKRRSVQVLAANAELLLLVASAQSPPFRPRFLDRLLAGGEAGGLEPVLALNKCDLGVDGETPGRLRAYREAGYRVIECSAVSGQGCGELRDLVAGRTAVFAGQSGVGKSSLLNLLAPGLQQVVAGVSEKYDRGVHTTSFGRLFPLAGGGAVIDTPGVREFEVAGILPAELGGYFREFAEVPGRCSYSACLHRTEPGCAVREAVQRGRIHPDRFESYQRMLEDLELFQAERHERARG